MLLRDTPVRDLMVTDVLTFKAGDDIQAAMRALVMSDIVNQVRYGNRSLVGVMIESNLFAGNQPIPEDLSQLKYGCSVTDACVDWETTEQMLREAANQLRDVLPNRIL